MEEDGKEKDSAEEEEPKIMWKKYTRGTKGPDGQKMKMGRDNICRACVQVGEVCKEESGRDKITCKCCTLSWKKCKLVTTDNMPDIPVMHGRMEYQVEKLALMQRGIEEMSEMRKEMCEMHKEMMRMWRLLERMALEAKADDVGDDMDDENEDEEDGGKDAEQEGE